MMTTNDKPLIIALDVSTQALALHWVDRLSAYPVVFKIGMQLFYQVGPDIVRHIQTKGATVFLDLKLHDIPNTVAGACKSIKPLEPDYLTVHTSGGRAMMEAAQDVFEGTTTRLLGITALTSLGVADLNQILPPLLSDASENTPLDTWVIQLATLAQTSGLWGVVCSAHENARLKAKLGDSLGLINPGIRLNRDITHDQQRVVTPQAAFKSGATAIVVGRPILEAQHPEALVETILQEIHLLNRC